MSRWIRLVARMYPRQWRARYGAEFDQLLSALPPTPFVLRDVATGMVRAHFRRRGGSFLHSVNGVVVMDRPPERFALFGAVLVAPVVVLLALSILKYFLGVPEPFDAVEPAVTPFVTHPLGEAVVTLAPYVAFLLAAIPVVHVGVRWEHRRLHGDVALAAPLSNVTVALVSALTAGVMVVYWVAENL
jgi:hypothetical protein